MDSSEFQTDKHTPRLLAQGKPMLPRSRSCEAFRQLTPSGEISYRMQPRWLPSENIEGDEQSGTNRTDNWPLSGDLPSMNKTSVENSNREFLSRATVGHCEYNAASSGNRRERSNVSSGPVINGPSHSAFVSEYSSGQTVSYDASYEAQVDPDLNRRAMASMSELRSDGFIPRTSDRGVLQADSRERIGMGTTHQQFLRQPTAVNYNQLYSESGLVGPATNLQSDQFSAHFQNKSSNKIKRPAVYDGETNWEDYLVQFELVSAINKWDDKEKALELATNLRGIAQSVLTDLNPEMRVNYNCLVSALRSRFQPTNQAEMYRVQMKSKIRGRNEPIPVLGQSIKRLARLAYPSASPEVREQLARDCFVDALNDAEMEWAIFQAKTKTIEGAIQAALEYEAFQSGRRKHTRSVRAISDHADFDSLYNQIDDVSGRLAKIEYNKPNATKKIVTCFGCGVEGHVKSNCPKTIRQTRIPSRNYTRNTRDAAVQTMSRGNF